MNNKNQIKPRPITTIKEFKKAQAQTQKQANQFFNRKGK